MQPRIAKRVRQYSRPLTLLLLLALIPAHGHAVWTVTSPPGEKVLDFTMAPSLPSSLFATTRLNPDTSIWKSINSGVNWTMQPPLNRAYYGIGVKTDDENIVLAGVLGGQLERSIDGGTSWTTIPTSASHDSWRIAFAISEPMTVYATGFTSGTTATGVVQKSIDAGLTWSSFAIAGDANPAIVSLAVAPTDADTVYVGAIPDGVGDDGLYKTSDGGANWTYLSSLPLTEVDGLAVDPTDPNVVYAGSSGSGLIRRSVDGGVSWQILHDPFSGGVANFTSVRGIAINPSDRRIIYALGGSGATRVIASTNCGIGWTNIDSSGIVIGQPSKAVIDTMNNFIYVLEDFLTTTIYREALLTVGSGSCSDQVGFPTSDGSGSIDYLLLVILGLLLTARYRRNHRARISPNGNNA